jgi:hypothetical protein
MIARRSWDLRLGTYDWREHGKWVRLSGDGDRRGYDAVWRSAWELEALGLVELGTVRCCPGTTCHVNDRREFRPTASGGSLLETTGASGANTTSLDLHPLPDGGVACQRFDWTRSLAALFLGRKPAGLKREHRG